MTTSDFICGVFFIFSIIKNFRHEKSRLVENRLKIDIRKNLEAIFIALLKPSLNEQKNFEKTGLSLTDITI